MSRGAVRGVGMCVSVCVWGLWGGGGGWRADKEEKVKSKEGNPELLQVCDLREGQKGVLEEMEAQKLRLWKKGGGGRKIIKKKKEGEEEKEKKAQQLTVQRSASFLTRQNRIMYMSEPIVGISEP